MNVSGKLRLAGAACLWRTAAIGLLVLMALGSGALAQSGDWEVLTYPDPAPGVSRTYCFGINDAGAMVGYYVIPGAPNRAYLLSDGHYYSLHPAGATNSSAWGINARGDIVGDYWIGTQEHGFLLRKGELITIDLPGRAMAHLRDINARGDIAGNYMTTSASPQQGFVLAKDGTLTEVYYPGAVSTIVSGVNDEGDVAGEYKDSFGAVRGFVRTAAGGFTSLEYPGASSTSAQKVNANGEVIGYYWDSASPSVSHGFVWRGGQFQQNDYPGAVHTMIHGLNNQGESCGMMSFTALGSAPQWGGFAQVW